MAQSLQELLYSSNPVALAAGSDLNSLASNGVVLAATAFSNLQGGSGVPGYPYVRGKLTLAAPGSAWSGSIYGWILSADDGTNYEYYNTTSTQTTPPLIRRPDFVWTPYANTSAQPVVSEGSAPICALNKLLIWNNAGQPFASTGNKADGFFYTDSSQP